MHANNSWTGVSFETSFCGITRIYMGSLIHQTEGQSLAASLSWIEMKLDKWLLRPRFSMSQMVSWALVTYHISIGQRAIGLPMGGLDSHMSQRYSPHDKAQSLLNGQAGLGIKSKNAWKSILLVSHNGTSGSDNQLRIRPHVNSKLFVYCL